jgi:hypothetical protein
VGGQYVNAVTIDKELRSRLNGLDQQVVLTDENGYPIGYFLPAQDYQRLMLHSLEIPLSTDEIERRRKNKGGRPLKEIWSNLRAE